MDLSGFGRVHATVRGDGVAVVGRIVKTCEEMLYDRGYSTVTTSPDVPHCIERGKPVVVGSGAPDREPTSVFLRPEDRVGIKAARQILEHTPGNVIVVSLDGATPFTKKECDRRIQFMKARELCVNVTRHRLVPKHVLCDNPPLAKEKLPKILDTDPIAVYYDFPVGSVVRIERVFGGGEQSVYFRTVVPAA